MYPRYDIQGTRVSAVVADDKGREYIATSDAESEGISDIATAMQEALDSATNLRDSEIAIEAAQISESAQ
ncbi:TPA: hypothetical protein LOL70_004915 [Salmonella enterica subsp. enterica serovar Infantis]|nr:hypothetical protein [Salmonella enterica subsp. enterica serovar Infantis]